MNIADQVDAILSSLRIDASYLRKADFAGAAQDIDLAIILIEHYRQVEAMHLKFVEYIKERVPG